MRANHNPAVPAMPVRFRKAGAFSGIWRLAHHGWRWSVCLICLSVGSAFAFEGTELSITNAGSGAILSWPGTATNWLLEQSPQVQPAAPWTGISPNLYQTNATSRYLPDPATNGLRFYRLRWLGAAVPGLTGHWGIDGGAGPFSSDGSSGEIFLDATNTAGAAGRFGAGALQFNGGGINSGGSRAWVSNTNFKILPAGNQPFSVSLWFNPDDWSTGWRGLMGNDANLTNGWHVALQTPGLGTNYLVFAATGAVNSLSVTGRTLLLPGQWHQLTVTHDGTNGSIYLDSALQAQGAGAIPAQASPIYFGGGVGDFPSFLGRIDEIHTYTNCLTREDISLTGCWHFDENTGCNLTDSSIQSHHAQMTDAAAWSPGHNTAGISLSNNRVTIRNGQYAVLPASGGAFSISLWLRPPALSAGMSGLMSCANGTNDGWQLFVTTDGAGQSQLHFSSTNTGGTLDLTTPLPLTNGIWTKLALTYNGGIATVYVNGRQVQTGNGAIRGTTVPLLLGTVTGMPNFNGVMDELKIYNRERQADEIGPVATAMWETVFRNSATNLVLQGSGPAGKPLTFSLVSSVIPTNGTVTNLVGSPVATYQAGATKGPDAFAYTVSDGEFTSAPAPVIMSVVEPHWLSPTGGVTAPLDGTSPEHAWAAGTADALDALWKTNAYFDCFLYAPGVYETRGWKYFERSTANPGCKHYGAGVDQTTLRLVDVWARQGEDAIFATGPGYTACDYFEVSRMTLDCNAPNVPKYERGEPVTLRIPLVNTGVVGAVTLRWNNQLLFGGNSYWQLGRAREYKLSAKQSGTNTYSTNVITAATGTVDILPVGTQADELILELDRRAVGVEFYSLGEIEISGTTASLPLATIPGGGESRLDATHGILAAVDDDLSTAWASGPESLAQITLPCTPGTSLSQVNLRWHCQTIASVGRLGIAADLLIRARDTNTGQLLDVPFVRHGQAATGWEAVTFGTAQSNNPIQTDQLVILLTNREPQVDFYSIAELTLQDGAQRVPLKLPVTDNTLAASFGILRAFDQDPNSPWTCSFQGMVGAVLMHGSNVKFTRLKIVGFGTKAGKECFPFAYQVESRDGAPIHFENVLVEDCVFAEPAAFNNDGITVVTMVAKPPATLSNGVIRRCTVTGVKSHSVYSSAFTAAHVEDCLVQDCGVGIYFEPNAGHISSVGPVLIRNNKFVNVNSGVNFLFHPGAQFEALTLVGNEIVLNPAGGGWGLSVCDTCQPGTSGSITNVTALNNIVRYPDWTPHPANPEGGLSYSDMHQAVYGGNIIALGNASALWVRQCPVGQVVIPQPVEDCAAVVTELAPPSIPPLCMDTPPPGYQRAWFNNRDLSGTLLKIRHFDNGIDKFASQQQWPE